MTDLPEEKITDQIDREIASSDGLLALILCLSVVAGVVLAGVTSFVGTFT